MGKIHLIQGWVIIFTSAPGGFVPKSTRTADSRNKNFVIIIPIFRIGTKGSLLVFDSLGIVAVSAFSLKDSYSVGSIVRIWFSSRGKFYVKNFVSIFGIFHMIKDTKYSRSELIRWRKVLLMKLMVPQLVKKLPHFYGTHIVFKKYCNLYTGPTKSNTYFNCNLSAVIPQRVSRPES